MVTIDKISNGLTVLVEEMPHFESVAFELLIPGGIVLDPEDQIGSSLILAELTSRGAGKYDSRALSEEFENLGIRHGEAASMEKFNYRASLLSNNITEAMQLVSLMVLNPILPSDEVENIKNILLQDIASLSDNPARRAMLTLSERYYPLPYSRPPIGQSQGLETTTLETLKKQWQRCYAPSGSVLSVAGAVKRDQVINLAQNIFGEWNGDAQPLPEFGCVSSPKAHYIESDSAQLQIVLAYPSACFGDKHYYAAKLTTQILSGGMFGRLFIEVREKRGLCYSVFCRHSATKHYGTVTAYAGTTPERAHETLEVLLHELKRLPGSVTEEELKRAKSNLKASLVIGEESPGARSSSNAAEWWIDKRVRGLEEIVKSVDAVTLNDIDEYCLSYTPDKFSLLTLGTRDLSSFIRSSK